jgi:hypothetical protein
MQMSRWVSKSGLTPVASEVVKPYRVKSHPRIWMQSHSDYSARTEEWIWEFSAYEVLRIHIDESVLDSDRSV